MFLLNPDLCQTIKQFCSPYMLLDGMEGFGKEICDYLSGDEIWFEFLQDYFPEEHKALLENYQKACFLNAEDREGAVMNPRAFDLKGAFVTSAKEFWNKVKNDYSAFEDSGQHLIDRYFLKKLFKQPFNSITPELVFDKLVEQRLSPLHISMRKVNALKAMAEVLQSDKGDEKRFEDELLNNRRNGTSAISYAAEFPESLVQILMLFPEKDRTFFVRHCDDFLTRETVLQRLADFEYLPKVMSLLPTQERYNVLTNSSFFYQHKTILEKIFEKTELFLSILELLPNETRLKLLFEIDAIGSTRLERMAWNPERLLDALKLLSTEEVLKAVKSEPILGGNLLHHVDKDPKILERILFMVPKEACSQLLKQPNISGQNLLEKTAHDRELFERMLCFLPDGEREQEREKINKSSGLYQIGFYADSNQEKVKEFEAAIDKILQSTLNK